MRDTLKRWVPEAELAEATAVRDGATLQLRVRFREAGQRQGRTKVALTLEG